MTVNNITQSAAFAYSHSVMNAKKPSGEGEAKKPEGEGQGVGDAFSVEISQSGKNAASASKSDAASVEKTGSGETKGLSADQVQALKDETDASYSMMIEAMTEQNMKVQNLFNEGIYDFAFNDGLFSLENFVLPPVGTTPEEAQAAISEGGAYSVQAVADRIFGLAEALAGGDAGVLQEMRSAVESGFSKAGVTFKDMTGKDEMPQITKDTYDEIMSRFDKKSEELSGGAAE